MLVLIADDTARVRTFVGEALVDLGCFPVTVARGIDAIFVAQLYRPPLVLLDGLLPEMHGFEVARFLRNIPHYAPRIVIMTGIYRDAHYVEEAKTIYGVDEYIVKPVTTEQLTQIVLRARSGGVAIPTTMPEVEVLELQ
jgi:CheY-like chemotaxis protein